MAMKNIRNFWLFKENQQHKYVWVVLCFFTKCYKWNKRSPVSEKWQDCSSAVYNYGIGKWFPSNEKQKFWISEHLRQSNKCISQTPL